MKFMKVESMLGILRGKGQRPLFFSGGGSDVSLFITFMYLYDYCRVIVMTTGTSPLFADLSLEENNAF